ncbi:MAG: ribosome recycling factor [Chloroflexi bacterium]|nr:ribosome recycling factor [Chloroflexota bacterium]
MVTDMLTEAEEKMRKACEALSRELAGLRTGRASPALVERLHVDFYGVSTPLNQLSNISTPEPRLLVIQPWDKSAISAIEKAIMKSDLGLMPTSDGRVIRLAIPTLTEERRRDLVKLVRRRVEEGRVNVRNVRREALEDLKQFEREKLISEDEFHRGQEQLQKLTTAMIEEVDRIGQKKEEEILEV